MERRGRRRQRSEDAFYSTSGNAAASAPSTVSAAEAAATLEFLDELGEFLELEHHPAVATPAASLEPIPFDASSSSSQSSPMSTTYEPPMEHLGVGFVDDGDKDDDEVAVDTQPVKKKKKKKSSTQRQKEELTYLRTKVGQLERELSDMKTAFRGGSSDQETRSLSETRSLARSSVSMWETMAQRQLKEKNRAELENAHLKQALEGEIKLAKGLERMLRKRQIWDEVQEPSPFSIGIVEHESKIYEFMAKSIEARIPSVDAAFEVGGIFGGGDVPMNEANTVHSDSEGLYIDFVDAHTIPFDFRATARMTWKHMGTKNPKLKTVTVNTLVMEQTDESLTTKHLVTAVIAGEKRTTTTRSEYRRLMREDHVLIVWHSVTESKGELPSGKPGIHISQQGCSKISRAETKDGSVATTSLSFVRMRPKMATATSRLLCGDDDSTNHIDSEGDLQVHQETGMFSEVVVSSFRQNVQVVRQNIENDLMDEFFEQQRTEGEIISFLSLSDKSMDLTLLAVDEAKCKPTADAEPYSAADDHDEVRREVGELHTNDVVRGMLRHRAFDIQQATAREVSLPHTTLTVRSPPTTPALQGAADTSQLQLHQWRGVSAFTHRLISSYQDNAKSMR